MISLSRTAVSRRPQPPFSGGLQSSLQDAGNHIIANATV
jgi:hypothetical protein